MVFFKNLYSHNKTKTRSHPQLFKYLKEVKKLSLDCYLNSTSHEALAQRRTYGLIGTQKTDSLKNIEKHYSKKQYENGTESML